MQNKESCEKTQIILATNIIHKHYMENLSKFAWTETGGPSPSRRG